MIEAPSGALLLELGADLDWPPVTLGTLTLRGADAWRDAMPRTAPIERRRWLQALGAPLLVATPPSRARLDAWRRSPVRLPATPEWLRENTLFYGDVTVLDHVVAALLLLPPAVREFVLGECCFQAVGADSPGWTGSSVFVDRDGRGRPRQIMLSGAAPHVAGLVGVTLHECAHAWSCPTPLALVSVQGEQGFRAYLADEGRVALADKKRAFDERIACALARVWGDRSEDA